MNSTHLTGVIPPFPVGSKGPFYININTRCPKNMEIYLTLKEVNSMQFCQFNFLKVLTEYKYVNKM